MRWEAFYHLQSFNYQIRVIRQKYMQVYTKNKKRKNFLKNVYAKQTYKIPENPKELEYRIENSKEQKLKKYDYFISHSSKDYDSVQNLISFANNKGKDVFCDWINDADYLKRHLVCAATKIYQSVNPSFNPDVEYMKAPLLRDIPSVDNSLFILARKLLLESKV